MANPFGNNCDFMAKTRIQDKQAGIEHPEDSDVLLPRGGSWSSLSSLSYIHEAATADSDPTSPKRASSLEGKKRHSSESAMGFFNLEPAAAASPSTPSVISEATEAETEADPARPSTLSRCILAPLASLLVSLYDLLVRCVMVSYYIVGLDSFHTAEEYLHSKALKQTRRYVEACKSRLEAAVEAGTVRIHVKAAFTREDLDFATRVLRTKHGMPLPLVWAWQAFATLLQHSAGTRFTTVTDCSSGRLVGLFLEHRQAAMHHFITALVDHEASRQHGVYIAKYHDLITSCIQDNIPLLRLGPTTAELKAGLGAMPLPPMVVGSAVWAQLEGRCSVICFGIFTSLALLVYLVLTQWHLDASGVGALSLSELGVLYICCMGCVKLLPLWSIGLKKIIAHPRKYLMQTSFYAQGAVPGAVVGIALVSAWRQANPLLLMDGLSLFLLVGESIGRLGCHFYGCCFGRALFSNPQTFSRWSVVYIHKTSSVARLRPEYLLRPLLPTQVLQSLFALVTQMAMLGVVASCQHAAAAGSAPSCLRVGMVGVMALVIYSVGRLIFFQLREDENFKSNRSFTTAYMALATLAGCAAVQLYSYLAAPASSIALAGMPTLNAVAGFGSFSWSYVLVAAAAAGCNFIVQGLHHHEKVGVFPDLAQLLAPIAKAAIRPEPAAGAGARPSTTTRQVWSSWQSDKNS